MEVQCPNRKFLKKWLPLLGDSYVEGSVGVGTPSTRSLNFPPRLPNNQARSLKAMATLQFGFTWTLAKESRFADPTRSYVKYENKKDKSCWYKIVPCKDDHGQFWKISEASWSLPAEASSSSSSSSSFEIASLKAENASLKAALAKAVNSAMAETSTLRRAATTKELSKKEERKRKANEASQDNKDDSDTDIEGLLCNTGNTKIVKTEG